MGARQTAFWLIKKSKPAAAKSAAIENWHSNSISDLRVKLENVLQFKDVFGLKTRTSAKSEKGKIMSLEHKIKEQNHIALCKYLPLL